jgi:rhamnosyltransferase
MSTYDGATYLEEQINSIINQDYEGWSLLIRDDGSADSTVKIINDFALNDDRITILATDRKNIGPASSFMQLLGHSASDYFMFADQDDVWLPDKISLTLDALKKIEGGSSEPCLVYTDLQVVDDQLNLISPSFLRYQRLAPRKFSCFLRELLQNIVTGCTIGGNAALRQKALNVLHTTQNKLIMHDWWLALVAFYFGTVFHVPVASLLYRQHGNNQLGAKGSGIARYLRILKEQNTCHRVHDYLNKVSRQCSLFLDTYKDELADRDAYLLQQIASNENSWSAVALLKCFWHGAGFKTIDYSVSFLAALLVCQRSSTNTETGK